MKARLGRLIFWRPAVLTLLLHGLLLYALTVNWSSATDAAVKPRVTPRYIEARLVQVEAPKPKPRKAKPKPKPKASSAPAVSRAAPAAKPKPRATVAKPESKPGPKPEPKPEPKVAEPSGPTAAERAELSRQELAMAMAAEDEFLEAASDDQLTASYIALIARAVEDNWSRPPSARNEMEAELLLQLIPTGEVVSVTLAESSGNSAFDRSAIMAVQKAERFPELRQLEPRLFEKNFRKLRLKFKPEDLRF